MTQLKCFLVEVVLSRSFVGLRIFPMLSNYGDTGIGGSSLLSCHGFCSRVVVAPWQALSGHLDTQAAHVSEYIRCVFLNDNNPCLLCKDHEQISQTSPLLDDLPACTPRIRLSLPWGSEHVLICNNYYEVCSIVSYFPGVALNNTL